MSDEHSIDEIRGLAERWAKEAEGHEASVSHTNGHSGPGWYWWVTEYPDEGSSGPFDTRDEAMASAAESDLFFALTEDETSTRREWVTREMAMEVGRRRECGAVDMPEFDREDLAHHIAHLLGGNFEASSLRSMGDWLPWSLCEWAGWPS